MSHDATVRSTATRRLSAGTYVDSAFRNRIIKEIYCTWQRRIAPSYGYDLVEVLGHAWRSWLLDLGVDVTITLLLVVGLIFSPLSVLVAAGLVAAFYVLVALSGVFVALAGVLRRTGSFDTVRGVRYRLKVVLWELGVCVVAVLFALFAMGSRHDGWPLRGSPWQTVLLLAALAAVSAAGGVVRQRRLDRLRDRTTTARRPGRRLRSVADQQHHPFTIYSGDRPFVGSGMNVPRNTWSFAQLLVHREDVVDGIGKGEEFTHPPFRTAELVDELRSALKELASIDDRETRVKGLDVQDRVFIEGTHVNQFPAAVQYPPDPGVIREAMGDPSDVARHHLACQIPAWDGELITTVFVHVSMQGRMLYIELTTLALTPSPQDFQVIDKIGGTGTLAAVRRAARDATRLSRIMQAPLRLVQAPAVLIPAWWAQRDVADFSSSLDVGAAVSARELAGSAMNGQDGQLWAAESTATYFQYLDVARHAKIIERRLLRTIELFLKARDVDTSDFVQRMNAILNNGIIHTGQGDVNVDNTTFDGGQPNTSD